MPSGTRIALTRCRSATSAPWRTASGPRRRRPRARPRPGGGGGRRCSRGLRPQIRSSEARKPAEQLRRRRVGEVAEVVGLDHVFEARRSSGSCAAGLVGVERLLADGEDAEAGRQHEALLRTRHAAVDAPLAHAHVERADRGDAVDEQQRGMLGGVERLAHAGDVAGDAGRRLVVGGEDGLDLVALVLGEDVGVLLERHARAPLFVAEHDLEAEALGHVDPEQRELAEAAHQNLVAGVERVRDGRFPGAGARRREDEDAAVLHLEDLLQIFEDRQRELREFGRAHVLHADVHRRADGLGNVGRAGNEEMRLTIMMVSSGNVRYR